MTASKDTYYLLLIATIALAYRCLCHEPVCLSVLDDQEHCENYHNVIKILVTRMKPEPVNRYRI